jgi:hypothetical protein
MSPEPHKVRQQKQLKEHTSAGSVDRQALAIGEKQQLLNSAFADFG